MRKMGRTLISSFLAAVCLWIALSLVASAGMPCDKNPCLKGLCRNNGSVNYYCDCPAGYSGAHCQNYDGLCINSPCNNLDPHATCTESEPGYQCSCDNDNVYGLNCESKVGKHCDEEETESYCVCNVDGLPVKVPLRGPLIHTGLSGWDFLWGFIGLLIGWLLGTLLIVLYHFCCMKAATRRRRVDSERPSSASSNQSQLTTLSSHDTKTPAKAAPASPPSPRAADGKKGANIYRAGFVDDSAHHVSHRKSPDTYTTPVGDW